jgi:hypothetical protein
MYRLDAVQQFAAVNLTLDPGYLPGPKIIPNCCMVRLNWNLTDGKVAHNVLYGSYTGTPALTNAIAQTLFAALLVPSEWATLAAFLASTASLASVTLLDVRSIVATEFQSTGAAMPGTSVGTALPDEVAAVMTWRTAVRGRSGRGRSFCPGWASNAGGAGGVMAAAAVTALQNWMSNRVYGAINSTIGQPVLGLPARAGYTSPVTGRVFPARAATTVAITGGAVRDNHWDTQRRRGLR